MEITILLPHFKTKKMTTYAVTQFLKSKGRHKVDIIVIDNSYPDESVKSLEPFKNEIKIISNTVTDKIQSHGIAYEMAIPHINTEYFITVESDSYPTNDKWIDYYEALVSQGNEWGGSILRLSGGQFVHPCGAFYKKSLWEEAKEYCNNIEYSYFPNMSRHTDFDCHLMVHDRMLEEFLHDPSKYLELGKDYKKMNREEIVTKRDFYKPIVAPFHNGMGMLNESLYTYGQRGLASEVPNILLNNKDNFINKIGMEPGQWLCYWLIANNKKGSPIPTEIKWMRNRGFQQQEYTLTENGLKHLWSVSAYFGNTTPELQDIVQFKTKFVDDLYNSLPEYLKK